MSTATSSALNKMPREECEARNARALRIAQDTMIEVNAMDIKDENAPREAMLKLGNAMIAIHRTLEGK